jgi:hypothetical protein
MAEVCTPPLIKVDGDGEEWVTFGPDHSLADICRWIMEMNCGEDVRDTLTEMLNGTYGRPMQ